MFDGQHVAGHKRIKSHPRLLHDPGLSPFATVRSQTTKHQVDSPAMPYAFNISRCASARFGDAGIISEPVEPRLYVMLSFPTGATKAPEMAPPQLNTRRTASSGSTPHSTPKINPEVGYARLLTA